MGDPSQFSQQAEFEKGRNMALTITPVPRNLATKVTFLYLEFEDLFIILGLAVVMNVFGRFLQREMFGI
jgi:hypothetical protein